MRTLLVGCVLICGGCESSAPATSVAAKAKEQEKKPAAEPKAPQFAPKFDPNAKPVEEPPPKPVEMERVPARPGVSGRGDYDPGIVTTPISSYWSLKEQLIFDKTIPNAIKVYEAARNRKLASNQEFFDEIIAKSNVKLPKLPPGNRYIYDPERGELMVERPKTAD